MKANEIPNIALDIETLSTQPTAAIISIAARVFTFSGGAQKDDRSRFSCLVDAASCAMEGMHFDMDTVRWWEQQSTAAKAPYGAMSGQSIPICKALDSLTKFIDQIRAKSPSNKILIWCQGTDFDIPILKHAYHKCLGWKAPWFHHELRDARTFIHTTLGLLWHDVEDPYSLIPKNPNWNPHEALSDVDQLIWNVCHVYEMFNQQVYCILPGSFNSNTEKV